MRLKEELCRCISWKRARRRLRSAVALGLANASRSCKVVRLKMRLKAYVSPSNRRILHYRTLQTATCVTPARFRTNASSMQKPIPEETKKTNLLCSLLVERETRIDGRISIDIFRICVVRLVRWFPESCCRNAAKICFCSF